MITRVGSVAERSQEGLALLFTETTQSASVGDADLGHGASCLDLADARKRFENRKNLDTSNKFIGTGKIENLTERQFTGLQLVLDHGSGSTRFSGFRERGLPLFWSEYRRLRHGRDHSRCPKAIVRASLGSV